MIDVEKGARRKRGREETRIKGGSEAGPQVLSLFEREEGGFLGPLLWRGKKFCGEFRHEFGIVLGGGNFSFDGLFFREEMAAIQRKIAKKREIPFPSQTISHLL